MPNYRDFSNDQIKPFFSEAQLHQLREVTLSGMINVVTILRRTTSDTVYGDDDAVSYVSVGTAKAWIYSTPTPVQQPDTGSVITVNTYRMYVPVGTNILPGDQIQATEGTFVVSDTTGESTWQAMTVCSLRKRE